MDVVEEVIRSLWLILVDAGLWLLLGFGVAGLLHAFVPAAWLKKHLGKPGPGSVVKGTLIGVPMPLCSCSVIPTAASLRRSGASKGASASFAVSTPEIDVPAFGMTWAMLGPVMAAARVIGAAVSAITAGLLIDAAERSPDKPDSATKTGERTIALAVADQSGPAGSTADVIESCCQTGGSGTGGGATFAGRLMTALRYGYVDLPADLAKWLVIGLLASAIVDVAVPAGWLDGSVVSGAVSILVAMSFGLVVYVCATGSTPLAAALVAKGLDPGAALAFLLAGPATNPATMAWVFQDLGKRALAIYLVSIGGVAFLAGWAMQWLAIDALAFGDTPVHEHSVGSLLGGSVLAGLLTFAIVHPALQRLLDRAPSQAECCGGDPEPCGCAPEHHAEPPASS